MTVTSFGLEPDAPTGTVVMWDRPLSDIPSGWTLCDGNNGTTNMLGNFPQHTNDDTAVGNTGGQNSYSLSTSQIPTHDHSGSTDTTGSHTHTTEYVSFPPDGIDTPDEVEGPGRNSKTGGAHSHSIDSVSSTGGTSSVDNLPAYYEVAFIQKL